MKSKENSISPAELFEVMDKFGMDDTAKSIVSTLKIEIDEDGNLKRDTIIQIQKYFLKKFSTDQGNNSDKAINNFLKFLGQFEGALEVDIYNNIKYISDNTLKDSHMKDRLVYIFHFDEIIRNMCVIYKINPIGFSEHKDKQYQCHIKLIKKIFGELDLLENPKSALHKKSELDLLAFIGMIDLINGFEYSAKLIDYIISDLAVKFDNEERQAYFEYIIMYMKGFRGKLTREDFGKYFTKLEGLKHHSKYNEIYDMFFIGALYSAIDIEGYTEYPNFLFINDVFQLRTQDAKEKFLLLEDDIKESLNKFGVFYNESLLQVGLYYGYLDQYQELMRLKWLDHISSMLVGLKRMDISEELESYRI